MNPADLPAVMTIEEAATFLRISRASAYRAVRRGELPCLRLLGKLRRIPRDRLLEYLAGRVPLTHGREK